MLHSSEPIFAVSDIPRTLAFYKSLGFGSEWLWGTPPGFAGIRFGPVHILFNLQPHIAAKIEGHQHFFQAHDIDALHAKHLAAGVPIISAIEDKPWGFREYTVRDPDGYHLRFAGQPSHTKPPTALATMPAHIRIDLRKPTLEEYRTLHIGVGWHDPKDPDAITRSESGLLAIDTRTNTPVGMLRIMHEGWAWYSIWDVIVLPEYQSQRIGTALLESALTHLRATAPAGSVVHLFTHKPAFYEKLGFKQDTCTTIRL